MTLDRISNLEDATSELSNRVYEAALIIERLEGRGLYLGNGHHAAQEIARYAVEVLRKGWQEKPE